MSPDSPQHDVLRPPHPLALALIDRLRDRPGALILELGRGSERNRSALEAAGFLVIDPGEGDDTPRCAGAISTHALLHGTSDGIAAGLRRIAVALEPGAPLYATFGSVRDARYGRGEQIETHTFAPLSGDETGVPHTFFDERRLRSMLDGAWSVTSLEEHDVDAIAGPWAHERAPLHQSVHWFAKLERR
ncbi:MAG TPA: hypothetical protein VGN11_06610 [Candidatus Baltobacteraceae bacterium]|jgi:hypothetical protein|nr:hypothetical protein [Candidatus Baltobacteraceae bacterium]